MGLVHFRKQAGRGGKDTVLTREVIIPPVGLVGTLRIPPRAQALVAFAHGSGSSRLSPRNRMVAQALNQHAIATLLFDLLTADEAEDRSNVFDIGLLADRVDTAVAFMDSDLQLRDLALGLFGASTGAAAALVAAARSGDRIGAVVSRSGRPDLAGDIVDTVHTPTLLIVGSEDFEVIELSKRALARLRGPKALEIVPGASHFFREPGALTAVTVHAARWFEHYLGQGEAKATQPQVAAHARSTADHAQSDCGWAMPRPE